MLKPTIVDTDRSRTVARVIEETLNMKLKRRMKKLVESSDFRVCRVETVARCGA